MLRKRGLSQGGKFDEGFEKDREVGWLSSYSP